MTNPGSGTAILYFSLSPKVQAQRKQWKGVSSALARKTQSKLFYHTEEIIKKSGLACIHSDETNQRGSDFGSKLSNAIEDVFSMGYDSVIVLGNDCPELNQDIIESAYQQLKKEQVVIGPSQSGGIYLLGFKKANFDKTAFQNLPWQSQSLQNALLAYFNKNSKEAVLLPFFRDLNRYEDLVFFDRLKEISTSLKLIFQALLQCLQHQVYGLNQVTPSLIIATARSHRGPPRSI
jgi:2-phospho-L-lactate guanylyltransferase (CobY/MobA/RfbA family)